MTGGSCRSEALTALVDGALSHDERDRVQAHLARCDACRAEVEAQRAVKARLGGLAATPPEPTPTLLAALRGLAVPGVEPRGRPGPVPSGPSSLRPPGRPARNRSFTRPATRSASRRTRGVRRTRVLGGGLLLAGVGLVLVLGAPATGAASTPVDPGSDEFVVDFVTTTTEVPLADPAGGVALLPQP